MASLALRPLRAAVRPRVVAIGLGNMGGPLAGRVAASFPTAVYDRDIAAVASHSQAHGSLVVDGGHEQLRDMASHSEFVLTCLPNTDLTRATVDALRPALRFLAPSLASRLTARPGSTCRAFGARCPRRPWRRWVSAQRERRPWWSAWRLAKLKSGLVKSRTPCPAVSCRYRMARS